MSEKKRAELEKKHEMKQLEQILPSFWLKTISFEAHYERWNRHLHKNHSYLWFLNALVTIGAMVAYYMIDGKELVLMYYIPLDFCFNISRSAYFWYNVYADSKKKINDQKLKKRAEREITKRQQKEQQEQNDDNATPGGMISDQVSNVSR